MPVWKLKPVNLDSPHWRASIYKGEVIVRASDEHDARNQATLAFGICVKTTSRENTIINPWRQNNLVECFQINDAEYEEQGPSTILHPDISSFRRE
jgi:hypothetical protein